jgi:hypothetical protein
MTPYCRLRIEPFAHRAMLSCVLFVCLFSCCDSAPNNQSLSCRTEFQINPDGVDPAAVHLSWRDMVVDSQGWDSGKGAGSGGKAYSRGETQLAYEVQVSGPSAAVAWASGKTQGEARQVTVPVVLKAGTTYNWRVRVWISSDPSTPTKWWCEEEAAVFDTAPAIFPGAASWIGGGGQMRLKAGLSLPSGSVAKARAYVTGVGAFYLFVNGQRVGVNIMDPPQTVYSKTIIYSTFDVAEVLKPGQTNEIGALLGTYKFGYTDQWCNMTLAGGPDGCRALLLRVVVTMADGSTHVADTSNPADWQARAGPILWDHFFHGETYDGTVDIDWSGNANTTAATAAATTPADVTSNQVWAPAVLINPPATAAYGMQVMSADNKTAVALGELKPLLSPPLRVTGTFAALSVSAIVHTTDVGPAYTFVSANFVGSIALSQLITRAFLCTFSLQDFGRNIAGMVTLSLPAGHSIPRGTVLRLEHGEVVQGPDIDMEDMCKLCPLCKSCGGSEKGGSCDARGKDAVCNTYCATPALEHKKPRYPFPLRHQPCFGQSYTPGFPANGSPPHDTPDRYIGDFNNANQTNLYTVRGDPAGENYTAYFAAAGFRYAQLSGLPHDTPATASMLTAQRVHSDVAPASHFHIGATTGSTFGTPNVLQRIHDMTLASQTANLWSIPTDCPQRERRGYV